LTVSAKQAEMSTPASTQPTNGISTLLNDMGNRGWILGVLLIVATIIAYQPAWNGKPIWDDENHLTSPEFRSLRVWREPGPSREPHNNTIHWSLARFGLNTDSGRFDAGLPPRQHPSPRRLCAPISKDLDAVGSAGRMVGGCHLRAPPCSRGIGGVDDELKNTLSGVFYLGSVLAYLKFDSTRKGSTYVLALAFFVLGLMSKSVIVTLPAAMLVVFWWKRGKLRWKQDMLPLIPFFLVGMAAGVFTLWIERKLFGAEGHGFQFSFVERCLIAGRSICFHLGKLFWPTDLIFMYPAGKSAKPCGGNIFTLQRRSCS